MISPRYASIGIVLVAIALFGWVGATNGNKGGIGTAVDVADGHKGDIASQPISMRVDSLIDGAVVSCNEIGGKLDVETLAVQAINVGGEPGSITVVDESLLSCSASASMYCGSGGCAVHFLSDQYTLTMQLQGWEKKLKSIRLGLHGTACGQVGAVPCFKELTFVEGSFYVE